jgi:hypothetical protein
MPKGPSAKFGVWITKKINGKIQYGTNGKPVKKYVQIGPGRLPDGSIQSFYDENGMFKGTTRILEE